MQQWEWISACTYNASVMVLAWPLYHSVVSDFQDLHSLALTLIVECIASCLLLANEYKVEYWYKTGTKRKLTIKIGMACA